MSTHEHRYLIKKRRYSIATNVILFCVVLLSIVACVMLDSLSATRESQRMQSYGAWHAALYNADDDLAKQLSENVMVDSIGIMYICGEICDASETDCGAIGYITKELLDFGNIELLDGSLPTQADEIALEASVLSKLGYSYELGQTVYLPLRNSDNEDCTYRSFVLSGVVKNYSGNWKCKNNHLVSGFVDASNEAEYQHAFIKLADKYAKYAEDINSICMHRLVLNDYTYSIYSSGNSDILDINLLQIAILFSGFTILLLLVNNEIAKKQSDYVVLQLLGANRSSIIGMFVHEKIVKFLMMILLGTCSGIFTAYLIHKIFLNNQGDVFFVNYSHVFVTVILNLAGILIALFFSFVRLFQIPLRGKAEQNGRRRSRLPRKPLTRQTIFLRFHWNDIHSRLLSLGLSVISALFVCISFYQTWNLFSD